MKFTQNFDFIAATKLFSYISKFIGVAPFNLIKNKRFYKPTKFSITDFLVLGYLIPSTTYSLIALLIKDHSKPENFLRTITNYGYHSADFGLPLISICSSYLNQKHIVKIFNKIQQLDHKLQQYKINLNNSNIKLYWILNALMITVLKSIIFKLCILVATHRIKVTMLYKIIRIVLYAVNSFYNIQYFLLLYAIYQRLRLVKQKIDLLTPTVAGAKDLRKFVYVRMELIELYRSIVKIYQSSYTIVILFSFCLIVNALVVIWTKQKIVFKFEAFVGLITTYARFSIVFFAAHYLYEEVN